MPRIVPPVTLANHFELIVHMHGVDSTQKWRNSIVIKDTSGVPADTSSVVQLFVNFIRSNLRTDVFVDHIELRNWTRGDIPFSQEGAIYTSAQGAGPGQKTLVGNYGAQGANAVGKEVAAFIRIETSPGKIGKFFLRQLLDDGDIAAVPGSPWAFLVPGPPNVTNTKFQNVVFNTIASGFTTDPGYRVVHFPVKEYLAAPANPANQPFSTVISTMQLVGPTVNKATRKNPR